MMKRKRAVGWFCMAAIFVFQKQQMNLPQPFSTVATKVIGFFYLCISEHWQDYIHSHINPFCVGINFENLDLYKTSKFYKTSIVLFPLYFAHPGTHTGLRMNLPSVKTILKNVFPFLNPT